MTTALIGNLRSRSFALTVHAALWLLLILVILKVGGRAPSFREAESFAVPPKSLAPIARLTSLFEPAQWPKPLPATAESSPFFTRHFVPVPSPAPPPPTTRKIEVTYQGYYEPDGGTRHAIIKVADAFVSVPIGVAVETNYFVAEATMQSLPLTNSAAQTTILPLNTKKEIEVPIK